MPSPKKVAWAQLKAGIVAALAMAVLAMVVFLITDSSGGFFQKKVPLFTYMSDSAAMAPGVEIRINGIEAGVVRKIEFSGDPDKKKSVRVAFEVGEEYLRMIPDDSIAAVASQNLLGTKYINIKRGDSPTPVKPGATLRAKDTSEFDDVLASSNNLLTSLQLVLTRIDHIIGEVEKGSGSIGKLIYDTQLYDNLNLTAAEARKMAVQLNTGKGTLSRLLYDDVLIDDLRGTIARMNTLVDGIQKGQGTAGKLLKDEALYDDLRKTVADFRQIAVDLNAGKGSAGKLLKDEALHKQIQGTIARMDTLIDKINKGEGTLGQLVVNPQMYESLNGATREMHEFMKAFRANPKKYLSIKLGLF